MATQLLDALEPALDWLEQRLVLEQANAPLPILADLIHSQPLLYRLVQSRRDVWRDDLARLLADDILLSSPGSCRLVQVIERRHGLRQLGIERRRPRPPTRGRTRPGSLGW
jgi:hypothetical protein